MFMNAVVNHIKRITVIFFQPFFIVIKLQNTKIHYLSGIYTNYYGL
jgi:hypothetical protein